MQPRLNYWDAAPTLVQHFLTLNSAIEGAGLEASLIHLVKLRASQINGCAYCIDMHSKEARKDGETQQRLDLLPAWKDSFLYTPRERAALAWAEAVTLLGRDAPEDALYAATRQQFDEEEIVKLTAVVTMINTWNRISIAFGAVHAPAEAA